MTSPIWRGHFFVCLVYGYLSAPKLTHCNITPKFGLRITLLSCAIFVSVRSVVPQGRFDYLSIFQVSNCGYKEQWRTSLNIE
jgi:hypothetical protein